jgi:hypothetical protein
MVSSQPKKRLYLTVGLMVLLILALLWHAGQYMQGSRASRKEPRRADAKTQALQAQPVVVAKKISTSAPGEAHAAGGNPPGLVRKKLPPMPPAPAEKAKPQPPDARPASEPATVVTETPQQPPASAPAPAAAAAPPAPEVPKGMPEKPVVAKPSEPARATAAAAPAAPAPAVVQSAPVPPPKPAPAKTIAKASPAERAAYPFSLLLSSNRGKENALTTLPDYRRMGLTPYLVLTDLGEKGKWWRTLYGYYPTVQEALQAQKALKLFEAVVVKTPFANEIGEYPTEKEAAEAAAQLSQKGLFPYAVKGPQNTTRLMAGAFPTRQEAEQQQRQLEAQGITARTIRR